MKRKILALTLIFAVVPLLAWGAIRVGFKANLTGSEVVPPVKTEATGSALLDLMQKGRSDFEQGGMLLHISISVQNLTDATAAHIHLGIIGKEGPRVVTIFPFDPSMPGKEGKFSGKLAEGMITEANLEGPLKGKPLGELIKEIQSGNTYIKVHTKQNPDGELRGQIVRRPS